MRSILTRLKLAPFLVTAVAGMMLGVPDVHAGVLPPATEKVVYTCGNDLCEVQDDNTGFAKLTDDSTGDSGPEVAPDGQHIAWLHDITELWVMDPDGANQRKVTDVISAFGEPTWSPDGSTLAASCNDPDDLPTKGFCLIDVATGVVDFQFELDFYDVEDLAWSPAGQALLFTGEQIGTGADLYTIDVDSGTLTNITMTDSDYEYGTWSPTGDMVAFVGSPTDADADDDPFPNLYRMNPDGSGRTMLYDPISLSTSHSAPAYAPNGDQIVWFCDDGAAGETFICFNDPSDGHLVNEFLEGVNGLLVGSDPDWSFTGGSLFMDLNCDGAVDGEDATIVLEHVADTLDPSIPCVPLASGSSLGGAPYMIGDGDCNDSIVPFDALLVLLARVGRPKSFPACPLPGQLADISIGA